jgi:hypothetical protein
MASGNDHDERLWVRVLANDGQQPPSRRVRMETPPSWASPLTKWGFIPHRRLPGLASCRGTDFSLLVGVYLLLLLQVWWQCRLWLMSYEGSSLHGRGSWTVGKAPSLNGGMDWRLSSAPRSRLLGRTIALGYTPLPPAPSIPLTST